METLGIWMIIGGIAGMIWYFIDEYRLEKHYDKGYWAGRNEGWKAALDHQQKITKLKSRAVFDYDKD